ncbi:MAG: sulfite exporter TauE/SafE family protein [Anaerolineae bacterium]|nr:sulfite exporter TauE/SafE family protein [Anaerolineae bacterium]
MNPTQLVLVALIAFAAAFIQSVVGFGSALLGMPLLVAVVGIQIASPLVAMLGVVLEMVLILRYREHLHVGIVGKLVAAAALGIPLGIYAVKNVDQRIVLGILAVVLVSYGVYGLSKFSLPTLEGNGWTYGLGFIAGILGGAYNTAGPPVIIYGHARRWPATEFKGNLQGFFLPVSIFVVIGHFLARTVTPVVWQCVAVSLLPMVLGILLGGLAERRIDAERFRKLVLVLLIVLGASLVL